MSSEVKGSISIVTVYRDIRYVIKNIHPESSIKKNNDFNNNWMNGIRVFIKNKWLWERDVQQISKSAKKKAKELIKKGDEALIQYFYNNSDVTKERKVDVLKVIIFLLNEKVDPNNETFLDLIIKTANTIDESEKTDNSRNLNEEFIKNINRSKLN